MIKQKITEVDIDKLTKNWTARYVTEDEMKRFTKGLYTGEDLIELEKQGVSVPRSYTSRKYSTYIVEYYTKDIIAWMKKQQKIEKLREVLTSRNLTKQEIDSLEREISYEFYKGASECHEHPYLSKRKIKPYGIKTINSQLVIPFSDIRGELRAFQTITEDGDVGGVGEYHDSAFEEFFFSIGNWRDKDVDTIIICGSYETGATIFEVLNIPVIVAFDEERIIKAAREILERYYKKNIVFAVDSAPASWRSSSYPTWDMRALSGGRIVFPVRNKKREDGLTFNKLYVSDGAEAVRACFENVLNDIEKMKIENEEKKKKKKTTISQRRSN